MRNFFLITLVFILSCSCVIAATTTIQTTTTKSTTTTTHLGGEYDDVLLVTNSKSQMSIDISNYFVAVRKVKYQVYIDVPDTESITYADFNLKIRKPIEKYLTLRNLTKKINYIVTTKGVPIKYTACPNYTSYYAPQSVDSALSVILSQYSHYLCKEPVVNPVYNKKSVSKAADDIYMVTRITGRTYKSAIALIKKSNKIKLNGTILLDSNPTKSGGYLAWDYSLREAAIRIKQLGYKTYLENTTKFLTEYSNLAGYSSWGSNDKGSCDVTANSSAWKFTFKEGAIGDMAVSTSGRTFNGYWTKCSQSLSVDLVEKGITGFKGYVSEPWLFAIARPDFLYDRYLSGYNLAQSFYMASKYISWQDIIIGDPKIRIVK